MNPLPFLLVCCAGWMNRQQQVVIEYLQEEIRVLKELLGKRPRFHDGQRRRLAVKGKPVGRKHLVRLGRSKIEVQYTIEFSLPTGHAGQRGGPAGASIA